jgi:hypothetical protein
LPGSHDHLNVDHDHLNVKHHHHHDDPADSVLRAVVADGGVQHVRPRNRRAVLR